jgi:DNA-directed RNA polymerase specialized sigma24 family protein
MSDDQVFADFIRRTRAGDAEAARELIRRYEAIVRMEIRVRLVDPRLGRIFDSMDICQSVMASFFLRAAAGQYELDRPQDLINLLVAMARNKLAFRIRKERAIKRDHRRLEPVPMELLEGSRVASSPSEEIASRELLEAFRQRLSDEERQLADRRSRGETWDRIATELGGTAESRRKQFERATDRVARQLGIEDTD